MDARQLSRGLHVAQKVLAEAGRTNSQRPLLQAACDALPDAANLKALLAVAKRDRDAATVRDCEARLEALSGNAALPGVLDDPARSDGTRTPIRSLADVTAPLKTPRRAMAYEPVPDRVLYVLHSALPLSSNGYSTRGHGVATGLLACGADLVCVTRPGFPFDLFKDDTPPYDVPAFSTVEGVRYDHLTSPTRKQFPHPADYLFQATEAMIAYITQARPAVVLAASNHTNALPACLAAHALGVPFVYEVRGFWEVTHLSRDPDFAGTQAYRNEVFLETETANAADAVLTLTAPMCDLLAERGTDPARIALMPNSCDPARFLPRPRDADLAAHYGIPDGVPVIGYIGSFVQYEGLEDLTQACAGLAAEGRDFRLLIVGSENAADMTTGPITAEIARIAAAAGITDKLIMPGRVPHEQVEAHYSLIDVAPFPRKPQPVTELVSPLKPLEALAMEKAVVVSSVRALAEMIQDGETGLVYAKGDIADMTRVLVRLLDDADLRARLGKAGRTWVETERTWTRTAQNALDFMASRGLLRGTVGPED